MDDRTTIASGLYLAFTEDALRRRINPPRDEYLDAMKQAVEEADMLLSELRRTAPAQEQVKEPTPSIRWRKMDDPPKHEDPVLVSGPSGFLYCMWFLKNKWCWVNSHDSMSKQHPTDDFLLKDMCWLDIGAFRPTEGDETPAQAPTPPKLPTRTFREMSDHPDTRRNVLVVPRDGRDEYAIVAWWERNTGKWVCPWGQDNLLISGTAVWTEIPRPTEGE